MTREKFDLVSGVRGLQRLAEGFRRREYSIRQFATFEEDTEYDRRSLVIGIQENGERFEINLQQSAKIIAVAPTGCGKTVLEQGFLSRFHAAGGLAAIPTDIKGEEYASCKAPAQQAHWTRLLKYPMVRPVDEKPVALPMKAYYPYFFSKTVGRSFRDQQFCQFGIHSLNMYDFLSIAGIDNLEPLQRSAMEELFEMIRTGKLTSLEGMVDHLTKTKAVSKSTARLLITTINQLKSQEVLGSQFPSPDFVADLSAKEPKIPILNTYGALTAGKNINSYVSAYVAIILRSIYHAKAKGTIPRKKHLMLILDEVNRFCPNVGNPTSKVAILDLLRLSRSEKISMFFSCQYLTDVPEILIDQATHIFVPGKRMNTETVRSIFQQFAPWENDNPIVMAQSISLRQKQMGRWAWFCLDRKKGETIMFTPALPLCYHRVEF